MNELLNYLQTNWLSILRYSGLHVGLVSVSTVIAIAIALPTGILVTRTHWRQYSATVLAIGNTFQTVPTLAVIGLASTVMAVFNAGIGWWPAILALVLYSILPILTNTISGIESLPASSIKSGRGMGLTDRQILNKIELPLAFPIILAGIRTAAVINIGTAALAAAIGADCLGTLIFQGISTGNVDILLAGAIPTAILAVITGLIFGMIERLKTPIKQNN
jgi:osmoprotectant transport system permease protein